MATEAMRVLDIDLDFFLSDYPRGGYHHASLVEGRLSEAEFRPWSEGDLVTFLEGPLGLSLAVPIAGVRVTHHDAAYHAWRRQVEAGTLRTPFDVIHIDSHADLGIGNPDYKAFDLIPKEILTRAPGERGMEAPSGLTPGNYLLYAAAAGWLRHITYVVHPERRRLDLPFDGRCDPAPPEILTEAFKTTLILGSRTGTSTESTSPVVRVPVTVVPFATYRSDALFDFIVVAQSPDFTPKSADVLLPVFERYIRDATPVV